MITNSVTALVTLQDIETALYACDASDSITLAAQIIHGARFVLETDSTLEKIKDTADTLKRAQLYFEQHRATLAAVNALSAEHIRLQWRMGNDLLRVPRQQGARTLSNVGTKFQQVLDELQVARSDAYRWQTLAQRDPQDLELYFEEMNQREQPITLAGILNYFTQSVTIDHDAPNVETETPEPPDDYKDNDEMPMPQFKRVMLACKSCGAMHNYEIEI